MKLNDRQMSAAILTALSELPEPGIAELFMKGGKLEVDFETQHAKLWPGMQMEAHPHPKVVVNRAEAQYLVSSLSVWVPPFPGAQLAHQKVFTRKGWDTLFAWARQMFVKSIELWVLRVREIEEGALGGLNSLVVRPEAGRATEQSRSGA